MIKTMAGFHRLLTALALSGLMATTALPALAASHETREFIREQDLNGDGAVTDREMETQRRYSFARIDYDENGTLSQCEYVAEYEGRLYIKLAAIADPVRREEEKRRQMTQAAVRFTVLDSNHDESMTWEEYEASGARMFGLHDQNKDGRVDWTDVNLLAQRETSDQGSDFISSGK